MAKVWNGIQIRNMEHHILVSIYTYRSLTNGHLSNILLHHLPSSIQVKKTNIARHVKQLRDKKMLKSMSCYPISKEYIHYLTTRGVDYVKGMITIDPEHPEAGFNNIHGDFTAMMLRNNLNSIEHHLQYLTFVTRRSFASRHNLYAVKHYGKKGVLRPDGEVLNGKEGLVALEIDVGTETLAQLETKFCNYKEYFDYCTEQNKLIPYVAIIFVTRRSQVAFQKDLRCHTIFKAAVKGLGHYCWKIIVNVHGHSLFHYLREEPQALKEIDIPLPPTADPVKAEKRKKEEEEKRREEKRLQRKERLRKEREQRNEELKQKLLQEAFNIWEGLPAKEKTVKVNLFKSVEDMDKKKRLIERYVNEQYEKRKEGEPLLDFSHLDDERETNKFN